MNKRRPILIKHTTLTAPSGTTSYAWDFPKLTNFLCKNLLWALWLTCDTLWSLRFGLVSDRWSLKGSGYPENRCVEFLALRVLCWTVIILWGAKRFDSSHDGWTTLYLDRELDSRRGKAFLLSRLRDIILESMSSLNILPSIQTSYSNVMQEYHN